MVRYVTPAEFQRLMRERQRAIENYNRKLDERNRQLRRQAQETARAIDRHNREVENRIRESERQRRRAIEQINQAIRAHNAMVRANEQRRLAALRALAGRRVEVRYTVLHTSAMSLNEAYSRLESRVANETSDANDDLLLDLPGKENANSLEVVDALVGNMASGDVSEDDLQGTEIEGQLKLISADLDSRWRGALFSLSPRNPDAARHFCTSAREVMTQILDVCAPDSDVVSMPGCALTRDGRPTRRAKVQFLLRRRKIESDALSDFVETDIQNVLDLFGVFNSATHGEAGKYAIPQLALIKRRVEGGIMFLSRLARDP